MLRAWDAISAAVWNCDECENDPALKEARGSCGGPFQPSLLDIYLDHVEDGIHDGAFVEDGEIRIAAVATLSLLVQEYVERDSFASCPVALMRDPTLEAVFLAYRFWDKGQLALLHSQPSAALTAGILAVDSAVRDRSAAEIQHLREKNAAAKK